MLNCKAPARERGLSLVEMTIALSVMAILAAMAVPSFSAWQGNTRIRAAAEAVHTGLNLARMEALTRNASVTFTVQPDGAWTVGCATSSSVCPATIHTRPGGEINGGMTLVLTLNDGSTTTSAASVTFNSRGRPDGASTSLRRIDVDVPNSVMPSAQSRDLRIALSGFGQSRLCDPNATGGTPTAC